MLVAIDAQLAAYEIRGIGKYILNLIEGLLQNDGTNEYLIYGPEERFTKYKKNARVRVRNPGTLPYPIWEQFVLPRWARQDRVEVLHCPANTAPLLLGKQIRLVLTIHDVMYLLPPEMYKTPTTMRLRLGNFYRRLVVPRVAKRARHIITVSNYSRSQILEHLKVDSAKVATVYSAIEQSLISEGGSRPAPNCFGGKALQRPFILALGAHDPRKNIDGVIRVYSSLDRATREHIKLVIVGLRQWRTSSWLRLAQDLGTSEDVYFAEYVKDDELAWLYTSAECVLFLSLFEGFGFPALEAMAFGAPLIASNTTSIPEIVGDAGLLVDPADEPAIRKALVEVLTNAALRAKLSALGRERTAMFTWSKTASQTAALY